MEASTEIVTPDLFRGPAISHDRAACRTGWTPEQVRGDERVAKARACIGARFRVHGRDPAFGLDCVGLAAVAFGRDVPGDYALRGGDAAQVVATIERLGLVRAERPRPGDLLLIAAGSGQLHLAVTTGTGFVHACARLRRVVETPGLPAGTIGIWREG